jgi:salicylate hydroxylase
MSKIRSVAIVGAGLGGLTTAIALIKRGFDVTVYEHSATISEIGAGVQLSPNAMKVLRALDLEEKFAEISFEPNRHVVKSWNTGRIISATPMKGIYEKMFGAGYFGAHRADFHNMLAHALPKGTVKLNARCIGASTIGDKAHLEFADGSQVECDVAVGADGIHSKVRSSLFEADSPRFTGNICWRGLVPAENVPPGMFAPDMTVWFGPNSNIVHYYVRGGKLINWVASHESNWTEESWKAEASVDEVIKTYEKWHPDLKHLFANTQHCYKWALFDRAPLEHWSNGRVTLLGDSAHAMLPYLAQGACMALEDAYALAQALHENQEDAEKALKEYERARIVRATSVQSAANARAKVNHLVSPWARLWRDLVYTIRRILRPSKHTYQIEWIYGHDITARAK